MTPDENNPFTAQLEPRSNLFAINDCSEIDLEDNQAPSPRVTISVNNKPINFLIDSGANDNILNEDRYLRLFKQIKLSSCNLRLFAYGAATPLKILGQLALSVQFKEKTSRARFKVVQGNCGCLLSHHTSRTLDLFQTEHFTELKQPEVSNINNNSKYEQLMDNYADVFNEKVGQLKDFEVHLEIDPNVQTKQIPYRRIGYHLLEAVDRELDKLLEQGIIEPVEKPIDWATVLVPVPKKKKPGAVRLTTDSRAANKAIIRTKYPTPTISEIAYDMNGAVKFSRIDFNKAFHQLVLDSASRNITTFVYHRGYFRFCTLNMGISPATEIFQHTIQNQVLHGLKGVRNLVDDLIVFGKTEQEHDENLRAVCDRLRECGLTASRSNCKLGVDELIFFGLKFNKNGIALSKDKVNSIKAATPPANASELRSLLGLFTYASSSIPNLATIADPLWKLTSDKVEYAWTDEHTQTLEKIKDALINEPCAYFNTNWFTEVHCDASPVGLCAVLAQVDPNDPNNKRIITNISRSLTDVERRYSQVEKEALAIVWAFERLSLYLIGTSFRCYTDNRAVQIIYSNPNSKPPARIERWALRVMSYNAEFVHKPGRCNIADYSSRHPIEKPGDVDYEDLSDEAYVAFITQHATPKAITREQLVEATEADAQLQSISKKLEGQKLNNDEEQLVKQFNNMWSELSKTSDGLILRGTRLVLPEGLRQTALSIAHEGHLGISKTKALVRTKIWFPGMDQMIEQLVDGCVPCKLNSNRPEREPLKPTEMPDQPWDMLAIDFLGPLQNKNELLVVIDEISRFPVVA